MRLTRRGVRAATMAGAVVLAAAAGPALAEFQFGTYAGWNGSFDSDVTYTDADDSFTIHDVPWLGLSFAGDGGAPYYGLRGTYWFESHPGWGVMLDFTHAKVRADPAASVAVTGIVSGGAPVSPSPVSSLFDTLEFTDGLNLLTVNGVYRMQPMGRFRPYVGVGAGVAVPHVEVTRTGGGASTFEYQRAGWAAQVLAGVEVQVWQHLSVFGEYKLSYADIDATLVDGGTLSTNILTNHALIGMAVHFGGDQR